MGERTLLTIPQAAKVIGLSRAVLWRHVRKQHIATVEAGPHILIDLEEAIRFKDTPRPRGRPRRTPPPADRG